MDPRLSTTELRRLYRLTPTQVDALNTLTDEEATLPASRTLTCLKRRGYVSSDSHLTDLGWDVLSLYI